MSPERSMAETRAQMYEDLEQGTRLAYLALTSEDLAYVAEYLVLNCGWRLP